MLKERRWKSRRILIFRSTERRCPNPGPVSSRENKGCVTQRTLTEEESRQIPHLIHAVNDVERVGDHAENLLELAERMRDNKITLTDVSRQELDTMYEALSRMFGYTLMAIETQDPEGGGAN